MKIFPSRHSPTPHIPWVGDPTGVGEVRVGQDRTLAGDTQAISHRVYTHILSPRRAPWTPGHTSHTSHPPRDPHAVSPQPCRELSGRLHCTLAVLHTPHTHSLLSSHLTSRPSEKQTHLDP